MVAFTASRQVAIQPWYDETTDALWQECGFPSKPPYERVWQRLRELEDNPKPWIEAIGQLIQRARRHDPRVAAHVHVDSTEDETHAIPHHDCAPDEPCAIRDAATDARGRMPAGRGRPQRVPSADARATRQDENEAPADETTEISNGPQSATIITRDGKRYKRFRHLGCWFVTRDTESGIRAYMGPRGARRFWVGYYNQKAVDHFTGGTLIMTTSSASRQEYYCFTDTYELLTRVAGVAPQTVIMDRGGAVKSVFEQCITNGTAPIIPWKPLPGRTVTDRPDDQTIDRHGIPRCKHCGAPTEFVQWSPNHGKPRLWVRCTDRTLDACERTQTRSFKDSWRLLRPLWRTEPLYHELRASHEHFEAAHDRIRDRYNVAADNLSNRPKVCSMAFELGWVPPRPDYVVSNLHVCVELA